MTDPLTDPNPLPDELKCTMKNCPGTWRLEPDAHYRCDSCDFVMRYDEMKEYDLFARHLIEQCPDLTLEDFLDLD